MRGLNLISKSSILSAATQPELFHHDAAKQLCDIELFFKYLAILPELMTLSKTSPLNPDDVSNFELTSRGGRAAAAQLWRALDQMQRNGKADRYQLTSFPR